MQPTQFSCARLWFRQMYTTVLRRKLSHNTPSEHEATSSGKRHALKCFAGLAVFLLATLLIPVAYAQSVTVDLGPNGGITERAFQLVAMLTVLSLAPSILVMVTSFTRIVIVLSLLRSALGTQSAPPNIVMIALALFLTGFIMQPAFEQAYDTGIRPMIEGQMEPREAGVQIAQPFREFMLKQVREKDLRLFLDLANAPQPETPQEVSLRILVPAFMISELRRAFEIGFLLFIPFLIIDLVVASILMSMGMMMLPPVLVSLPFKLIFFVLVDGWNLLAGSLVQSFGTG